MSPRQNHGEILMPIATELGYLVLGAIVVLCILIHFDLL